MFSRMFNSITAFAHHNGRLSENLAIDLFPDIFTIIFPVCNEWICYLCFVPSHYLVLFEFPSISLFIIVCLLSFLNYLSVPL